MIFLPVYSFFLGFHSLKTIVSPMRKSLSSNLISAVFLSLKTSAKYSGRIFKSCVIGSVLIRSHLPLKRSLKLFLLFPERVAPSRPLPDPSHQFFLWRLKGRPLFLRAFFLMLLFHLRVQRSRPQGLKFCYSLRAEIFLIHHSL